MQRNSPDIDQLNAQSKDLEAKIARVTDKDAALQLAVQATELAMKSLQLASDSEQKTAISKRCKFLLNQAEKIKQDPDWQPLGQHRPSRSFVSSNIQKLNEPLSSRQRSTSEKIILLKASKLDGSTFPEWDGPPASSQFEPRLDQTLFLDSPELSLSQLQLNIFQGWKRPSEAVPPPTWYPDEIQKTKPVMDTETETDLVQDAATDCSVVASLCADSARADRGHSKIIPSKLYPHDPASGTPQISPNGKYVVQLNFNGCYRKVEIDDRLPVSKTQRTLHVIDRHNPAVLWPALVEKAYLKVRGGYDFPGSNSGTDLWVLTGWIPQQVFLQNDETVPSQLWKRIFNAFIYGDVLITMGTGKISNQLEREIGLAGEHDYAVLDLREEDGKCLLLVKNPWCEGTSWKGRITALSEQDDSRNGHSHKNSNDVLLEGLELETKIPTPRESKLKPGVFWIEFHSVLQYFESIYLNWNPGLFTHRQDMHFWWNLTSDPSNDKRIAGSLVSNPQFVIASANGAQTWLLLNRHLRGKEGQFRSSERSSLSGPREEFISLYVFKNGGKRVYLTAGSIQRGPYVDSPQTLLCLELEPSTSYTVVACEQDLKSVMHTFTFTAFSRSPITLSEAPNPYSSQTNIQGSWNKSTSGGNASSSSYLQNPQYSLTLPQKTSIAIVLLSSAKNLHVHLKLLHSGQRANRITSIVRKDVVIDSGDNRQGSALVGLSELDAGTYVIICSTFEAGQEGNFTLRVDSAIQISLRKLPQEGSGRLRKKLANASFREKTVSVAAPIVPKRLTRLVITAKHQGAFTKPKRTAVKNGGGYEYAPQSIQSRSLLQISVEIGQGPMRRILVASSNGQHADAVDGICTEDVDLYPEMLAVGEIWLVLDRMSAPYDAVEEWFEVEMFSDTPDGISIGVWRTWDD